MCIRDRGRRGRRGSTARACPATSACLVAPPPFEDGTASFDRTRDVVKRTGLQSSVTARRSTQIEVSARITDRFDGGGLRQVWLAATGPREAPSALSLDQRQCRR